jgi:hypothetical protein
MNNQHNEYGKDDFEEQLPVLGTIGLADGKTLNRTMRIHIFDKWCQEAREVLTFDYHFLIILKRIHSWWQEEWKSVQIRKTANQM